MMLCKLKAPFFCFALALVHTIPFAQDSTSFLYHKGALLFSDDFSAGLKKWIAESPATTNPKIEASGGKLTIEVTGGATVWFAEKLSGNYVIEFKRKVVVAGGDRDRLSDLNVFWAASDPRSPNLFTRTGVLEEYDSLKLYYVGMGGNSNRTTRFRKYEGNGEKTLLQEYADAGHLLEANKEYAVQIAVYNGVTEFFVNGQKYFSYNDPSPYKEGLFGLRTTKSHHEVSAFKVYRLK